MATANYEDFLPDVLVRLSADPGEPVAMACVRQTVDDFCRQTWVWQEYSDPLDVTAGQPEVDFEPPAGAVVVMLLAASMDGRTLRPESLRRLEAHSPDWRRDFGEPECFSQIDTERLLLAPAPASSAPGALSVLMALAPARNAETIPQWLFNRYNLTLVDGITSRLMLMGNRPWSDAPTGADLRARYERGLAQARAHATGSMTAAPARVRGHYQ
ncbi:MAG: hypothetical protein IJS87_02455 [Rhodocyclaceae bacterium]|nr:hypothetical protein [Rhodocyclaceae bacterium]